MAVATPISTWVSSILTSTGVNQSTATTITVSLTAGWEIQLAVQVQMSTVSANPVVNVYPSMDGGASYDTTPFTSISVGMLTSGSRKGQASVRLSSGQYAIQIITSGPSSQSIAVLTQLVITAINNA